MPAAAHQKIIARAAGRDHVEPGEYVSVSPDYTVCQEIAWPARKRMMERAGVDRVARPDKVVMVVDHTTSAGMGTPYYQTHREMRDFADRHGAQFYGAGAGLRHQVLIEQGYARPGTLVFSDEPNIASIGAVGALNISVSSEVVATTVTDRNWMMVPRPVRLRLEGRLPFGVQARDFVQVLIRDYAESDALSQSCIEYTGPGAEALTLDQRQTILACTYHAGADTALMPLDETALAYARGRAGDRPVHLDRSDPDAVFDLDLSYDLGALSPMITVPPDLHLVVPVAEAAGRRIDQAAVGSCANSRIEDLRAVAEVLEGRRVAPHVTFYVTPGSREIYAQAAREGLLAVLVEAGATILAPGCTTCWGYEGFLNPGEVQISTHQMNYRGRNGSRESLSFLAGPYAVAAAAVAGRIIDPRELLAEPVR